MLFIVVPQAEFIYLLLWHISQLSFQSSVIMQLIQSNVRMKATLNNW